MLKYPFSREQFAAYDRKQLLLIAKEWGVKDVAHVLSSVDGRGLTVRRIKKIARTGLTVKFGDFIREVDWYDLPDYVDENKITQMALAEHLGLHNSYICKVLRNIEDYNPNASLVEKFSQKLGISIVFRQERFV